MPKQLTIEEMRQLAKFKEGECLSNKYINSYTKLKFMCKNHHIWETTPDHIKKGCWCPICAINNNSKKKINHTIEEMQNLASKKDGLCLSNKYINGRTHIKWKCNKDEHIWLARPDNILSGKWCPKCKYIHAGEKRKHTLNDAKNLAYTHNGKCLSNTYYGNHNKLKWECDNGHIWNASYSSINNLKTWCPICNGGVWKDCLADIQSIAKSMGGKCLTKKYINSKQKINLMCEHEHRWKTTTSNIRKGKWCPYCSSSRSEKICRKYLESKTNMLFKKTRPSWLNNLELDGYCKELNLAFEYNGKQHYNHTIYFHTKQEFLDLQKRDKLKYKLCKINGVRLIKIPYQFSCYNKTKLYDYIDSQLNKLNIKL